MGAARPTCPPGELKAHTSPCEVIRFILGALARAPVELLAVIVDKHCILRAPADASAVCRAAATHLVRVAAIRHSGLEVCLDRRYTRPKPHAELARAIQEAVADLPCAPSRLGQKESAATRGLRVCRGFRCLVAISKVPGGRALPLLFVLTQTSLCRESPIWSATGGSYPTIPRLS